MNWLRSHRVIAALASAWLVAGCASDSNPTEVDTPYERSADVRVLQQIQHRFEDVLINATNDCTGQVIPVIADTHLATFTFIDANRQLHNQFTFNIHASGTDQTTGVSYTANQVITATNQLVPGTAHTVAITFTLIAAGDAPDQRLRWKVHLTENANGELTVEFDEVALIGEGCPN